MTDLIMPRRKFLTGLFGLVAAPAVVKASSLMPVKSFTDLRLVEHPFVLEPIGFRSSARLTLSQFRELVRPALDEMFDNAYQDRLEEWAAIFGSKA